MGRDNQPKDRQLRRREIKTSLRASYARVLIVTEGSKTEPMYLEEIRGAFQLHSANVAVQRGQLGTAPLQVVQYARQLFEEGDLKKASAPGVLTRCMRCSTATTTAAISMHWTWLRA